MRKLKAGQLRYVITIERYVESQDEFGNIIGDWVEIKSTRAAVNPIAGDEIVVNDQIVNNVDNEIIIRHTDIRPDDRIVFNNRILNIRRVLDFESRRIWQQILAKEDMSVATAEAVNFVTYNGEQVTYNGEPVYYQGDVK